MGSILVRGLNQKTIKRLKERAQLNGRTLQLEVKALLERAAETLTMPEARRVSEQWRHLLGGRSMSDSAQLIREDRDSRQPLLRPAPSGGAPNRVSRAFPALADNVSPRPCQCGVDMVAGRSPVSQKQEQSATA
jgi:hypothetical protein